MSEQRRSLFSRMAARAWRGNAGPVESPAIQEQWRLCPANLEDVWARCRAIEFSREQPWPRRHLWRVSHPGATGDIQQKMQFNAGMSGEFAGFRDYQSGDDIRAIDWRATARRQKPVVRTWEGESQTDVIILVDVSASAYLTADDSRHVPSIRPIDIHFELATMIAAAALIRQIRVSLVLISERIEMQFSRLNGRTCLSGIIKSFAEFTPTGRATDWQPILPFLRAQNPGSWLFLLSDFHWLPDPDWFFPIFRPFRSLGVNVSASPRVNQFADRQTDWIDVETGEHFHRLESNQKESNPAHDRLFQWSRLAGMPVLNLPVEIKTPEKQLSAWLRGEFAP